MIPQNVNDKTYLEQPPAPTYEEVTELCAKLTVSIERTRRHRRSLIRFGYVGVGILIAGLIASNWGEVGQIMAAYGLWCQMLFLAVAFGASCLNLWRTDRILKRLALVNDVRILDPLMELLPLGLELKTSDNSTNQLIWMMLTKLLPLLPEENAPKFAQQHGEIIRRFLRRQSGSQAFRHTLFGCREELLLAKAMLDFVRLAKDTSPIDTVRSIAQCLGGNVYARQMHQAARKCLAVLEEQKRKEQQSLILLRASQPQGDAASLLRSAGYSESPAAEELLRAGSSQHS